MSFCLAKIINSASMVIIMLCSFPILSLAENYICPPGKDIQFCVDQIDTGEVYLKPGNYFTKGVHLKSNLKLIIPKGAFIQLSADAILNPNANGGIVNAIFFAEGRPDKPIENVHILLDGIIDGNSEVHISEHGGLEGINFKYVRGGSIKGNGIIQNVNGDGIDIDASSDLLLENFTSRYNGGSGIHFGAPRPLSPSKRNFVIGVTSIGNGFERERNGFDLSWPNPWGAFFVDCVALDNFRNWEIQTSGIILDSKSSGGHNVDYFEGDGFYHINGKDRHSWTLLSTRTKTLLKRDINQLFGREIPDYLLELEYK